MLIWVKFDHKSKAKKNSRFGKVNNYYNGNKTLSRIIFYFIPLNNLDKNN